MGGIGTDLTSMVAVPRPLQGSGGDAWKLLQHTLLFPFCIAVFLLQLALHEWRDFSVLAGGSSSGIMTDSAVHWFAAHCGESSSPILGNKGGGG